MRRASKLIASAPASRSRPSGTSAAQQCTTRAPSATTASTRSSHGRTTSGARPSGRCRTPTASAPAPPSTAGSDGSSSCTTSRATGQPSRTSARWSRRPSASDSVRSRAAPWSDDDPVPGRQLDRGRQRPRTGDLDLERPVVLAGRAPRARRGRGPGSRGARRRSRPGCAVSRQPEGWISTGRSASRAAPRPIMSAPGTAGRQLRQVRQRRQLAEDERGVASTSVPGIEPMPVTAPGGHGWSRVVDR